MTAADWLKFAPGWFAAVVAAWTLTDKWRTRRHKLALGPDEDALRAHLRELRTLLDEVASGGRRSDWFMHEDRRDVARALRDSAERRTDPALKLALMRLADAWDQISALAPQQRNRIRFANPHALARGLSDRDLAQQRVDALSDARDIEQLQTMTALGRTAVPDVQAALDRLNELERRTHGRS